MVEADKIAFVAVLNGLAAIKPGAKLTAASLEIYWSALRDWPIEDFRAAASYLASAIEFMPNPYHFAQLRRKVGAVAADAWAAVLDNIRAGDYRNGTTVGGLADRVVRAMGGYQVLAMSATDTQHFRARKFEELWDQLSEASEVRAAVPALTTSRPSDALTVDRGPQSAKALLGLVGVKP